MKKILLLIIGFLLISLMSFGKATNEFAFKKIDSLNFFNNNTKLKTTAIERHRVWLNLTNTEGLFKQILVGYITDATNGIDNGYDGISINGNRYLDFYSVNNDKNLVIQGRALPFVATDRVPLGYRTTVVGLFTITIDEVDGDLTTQDIFIEDKITNVVHNLKNSPYTFTTDAGTFNDRFVLCYVNNSVLTTEPIVEDAANNPIVADPIVIAPIIADVILTEPIVSIEPVTTEPVIADPIVMAPIIVDAVLPEPIVNIEPVTTGPVVADPIVMAPIIVDAVLPEPIVSIETIIADPVLVDPVVIAPIIADVVSIEPIVSIETITAEPIVVNPIVTEPTIIPIVSEPILLEPLATVETVSIANQPVLTAVAVVEQLTDAITFGKNKYVPAFGSRNVNNKENSVLVSAKDYQIKVNSFEENIGSIFVYDLGGKQLYKIAAVNSTEFVISNLEATNGFLIVKTQLKDGKEFVNKIVF